MELSEQRSRRPITEKLKCPNCGAAAVRLPPLSHSRWWCTACWKGSDTGPLITQESFPPVSDTLLMEEVVRLKTQNLAFGLDADRRDQLFHQLEVFEGVYRLNFASAWQSCDAELQAIRRTRETERPNAFRRWLNRWLRELIKLQRQIIDSVRRLPDQYGVSRSKSEEWIDEVFEVFWIRLGRQYGAWIVAAAFEPETETAPAWLCVDTLGTLWGGGVVRSPATSQWTTEQTLDHLEGQIDRRLRQARRATHQALIAPDIAAAPREVSRLGSLAEAGYAEQPPAETRRSRLSPIRRNIDLRKQRIAEIKAQNPRGISAREICEQMDTLIERVILRRQQQLQPLDSWMRKAQGKRTWTDLLRDHRTNKALGKYISKVPALRTSKERVSR